MFQKNMPDYFQLKLKEMKSNYTLALKEKDIDGVHDLRVALKRMRAFFNLVEAVNGEFKANKNFRNYKKISGNTGGLRDSQVQRKLLDDMNKILKLDVNGYENFLKKKEDESFERFLSFSQKEPLERLKGSKKIITKALKNITGVHSETKAQGRLYNLKNNLILISSESDLKEEQLHRIRILSKETHYTFEIIQQCFHIYVDRKDFIKEIKKVHQILGKWHDYDICLLYLNDFLQSCGINPSAEPYSQLARHLREEKKNLNKNFRFVFDEFNQMARLF